MRSLFCIFLFGLALPAVAGSAEIVDRDVTSPALRVDGHGVALVTYSAHGGPRHVLYWGAIDSATRFSRDYSGGWRSKVADYRRFSNNCRPYTGPPLALLVAACDAQDGSHWALQQWQRLWQNYGGASAAAELYISHWRDGIGTLSIQTDYSYRGRFQHLWGSFVYHGKAVFGTHHTLQGVPTDGQGRNIYVDYLTGPVWRRVEQLLDPSARRRLLLHVCQSPGRLTGLERRGHRRRLPRNGNRPRRVAARADAVRAAGSLQPRNRRRRERPAAGAARRRSALPHRLTSRQCR